MKICVLGAGVVGCATAYALLSEGHEVILIDSASQPGTGTSFANGAQLSYSYVEPLASPATARALPKLLFAADSPVRFRLRIDPLQWTWGLKFLAACTTNQVRAGTTELLALGQQSRETLDRWMSSDDLDFGFSRNGKLVICHDAASLERQAAQVSLQAQAGASQQVLTREECLALEPALAHYSGFVGGVWTAGECVGDPHLFCRALVESFRRRGGSCLFDTRVDGFVLGRQACSAVRTANGPIAADAFVVTTGLAGRDLARDLGDRIPIYPIKGYSLTLRVRPGRVLPKVSVTDLGRKMVLAPLGDKLRVAAMAELTGEDFRIPAGRIEKILSAVEALLPGVCDHRDVQPWVGLRPATPTSVPIIRRSRVTNVVLNLGHGALGFTLAAGSAQRVLELVGRAQSSTAPVQ